MQADLTSTTGCCPTDLTPSFCLEVCVDSLESVETALRSGAHRIELCSALSEGGLTPSIGFVKSSLELGETINCECEMHAMLRVASGFDFVYSDAEFKCMLTDLRLLIECCKVHRNFRGVVFGACTKCRVLPSIGTLLTVDTHKVQRVAEMSSAHGLQLTFHRAVDSILRSAMVAYACDGAPKSERMDDSVVASDSTGSHPCGDCLELKVSSELSRTPHFAFLDFVRKCASDLVKCSVHRVLTSGGHLKAEDGIHVIKSLRQLLAERCAAECTELTVVAIGSGVTPRNACKLLRESGCTHIHGSFSKNKSRLPQSLTHSSFGFDALVKVADECKIKAVLSNLEKRK